MEKVLEESVASLINKSISGIESATNFLVAEIPDVIHQLLLWNFTKSVISFVFFISIFLGVIWGNIKLWEWGKKQGTYSHIEIGIVSVFLVCFNFALLDITWLKIWIAPKIWLLEYAAKLVK